MKESEEIEPLKLLLIGDSIVGKTCFYLKYSTGLFNSVHMGTIGVDYFPSSVIIPDQKRVNIRLWDTAGQDRFRAITKNYIRGAHGILLLYDITCKKSFENVVKWISQVKEMSLSTIQIIIIGNKCDLQEKREVLFETGKELANKNNCLFLETSAKENININEAIAILTEKAYIEYLNEREKEQKSASKKSRLRHKNKKKIFC